MDRMLTTNQIHTVQAEMDRQRIVEGMLHVAVGAGKTADDYACMIERARYEYSWVNREHGWLYRTAWGIAGTIILAAEGWYRWLRDWNREA